MDAGRCRAPGNEKQGFIDSLKAECLSHAPLCRETEVVNENVGIGRNACNRARNVAAKEKEKKTM